MASYITIAKPNANHDPDKLTDLRLHEDNKVMSRVGVLDSLLKVGIFEYKIKTTNQLLTGFIAQDIEKVFPDVVDGKKHDCIDKTPRYRYFNNHAMLGKLTLALQEMKQLSDRSFALARKFTTDESKTLASSVTTLKADLAKLRESDLKSVEDLKTLTETYKALAETNLAVEAKKAADKSTELNTKIETESKIIKSIIAKIENHNKDNLAKINKEIALNYKTYIDYIEANDKDKQDLSTSIKANQATINQHKIESQNEHSQIQDRFTKMDTVINANKNVVDIEIKALQAQATAFQETVKSTYLSLQDFNEFTANNDRFVKLLRDSDANLKNTIDANATEFKNSILTTNKAVALLKQNITEASDHSKKLEKALDSQAMNIQQKLQQLNDTVNNEVAVKLEKLITSTKAESEAQEKRIHNYFNGRFDASAQDLEAKLTVYRRDIDYLSLKADQHLILNRKIDEFLADINNRFSKVYDQIEKSGEREKIIEDVRLMINSAKYNATPLENDVTAQKREIEHLKFTLMDVVKNTSTNVLSLQTLKSEVAEINSKMNDVMSMVAGMVKSNIQKSNSDNIEQGPSELDIVEDL